MSIKIEGGDGSAENVIKAGTSNELLYNDKEVLLKENLGSGLLPPDLAKAQEWSLNHSFTVPKDGWIVKVEFKSSSSDYIRIDGYGKLSMTPSQIYVGEFETFDLNSFTGSGIKKRVVYNAGCPYLVKKGQVIEPSENSDIADVIITFAPFMSV